MSNKKFIGLDWSSISDGDSVIYSAGTWYNVDITTQSEFNNHTANTDLHLTSTQNDALDGANSPNSANTIATMNDLYWVGSSGINSLKTKSNIGHASGDYSVAIGYNTIASGDYSVAIGYNTTASGDYSYTLGYNSIANNRGAYAQGNNTRALGVWSHSQGASSIASGDYAHAEGRSTTASNYASHSEGVSSIANGLYGSHAEGHTTTASGTASHSEGRCSTASGYVSHVQGNRCSAYERYTHAGGFYSIASGTTSFNHSHYLPPNTTSGATGKYSAILGGQNNHIISSAHSSSILGGTGNTISHTRSIILGGYDISTSQSDTVYAKYFDAINNYYANGLSGVTGTFTNTSGNTLTITNGIITAIT